MRVLLAGGGTGGHINPAIAIANEWKKCDPKAEFLFAATPGNMEDTLVPRAGYPVAHIQLAGFYRSLLPQDILHNLKAAAWLATSDMKAARIVRDFRPDFAVGTGGYLSGPIIRKAQKMGIPTFIHEQNAFPGVTSRLLAPGADIVFSAFAEAKDRLPQCRRFEVVGNPVRQSFIGLSKKEARKQLGLDDHFTIFSVGGSLGATRINQMAADLMAWHCPGGQINHIHGYGKNGRELFPKMLAERGVSLEGNPRVSAQEYIDNIHLYMAAADLIISRAGAITISELQITGTPSILVPYPYAAENHQYHNAMVLQKAGAALVVEEKDYQPQWLIGEVQRFVDSPERVASFSAAASRLATLDTAQRICQMIEERMAERKEG